MTFEHKEIIRELSIPVEVIEKKNIGIVAGKINYEDITHNLSAAILEPNYKKLENDTNFLIGDKVVYFLKNEDYTPSINDCIIINGREYIFKQILNNDYLADYIKFLARRKVDGYKTTT